MFHYLWKIVKLEILVDNIGTQLFPLVLKYDKLKRRFRKVTSIPLNHTLFEITYGKDFSRCFS